MKEKDRVWGLGLEGKGEKGLKDRVLSLLGSWVLSI